MSNIEYIGNELELLSMPATGNLIIVRLSKDLLKVMSVRWVRVLVEQLPL